MGETLDEILGETFAYGVGTNSEDIKRNNRAYLNLKKHAITKAKQAIKELIADERAKAKYIKDAAPQPMSPELMKKIRDYTFTRTSR